MATPVTVLVLDSQPISPLKKALGSADRLVVSLADPELARHALTTMVVGVWVCDIDTPDGDVKSLLAIAESVSPGIRVVFIGSKLSQLKAKDLMHSARDAAFMTRPLAIPALVKTVASFANDYRIATRKNAQSGGVTFDGARLRSANIDDGGAAGPDPAQYDLLRLLGTGGTGTVFLARDKFLDIDVALKVISPELLSDPDTLASFKDEARIAMQLSHRSIMRIYNYSSHKGCNYLVMEFLRGATLRDAIVERGALSVLTACRIIYACADALDYAHANNVVHNDIKPENIFITDSGEVKIIDFGTATLRDAAREINHIVGTPEYICPERLRLEISGPPADIYALGIIAFLMLMGDFPFPADTTAEDLLAGRRPDFSALPENLAGVLEKATAADPAERYQEVTAFALDFLTACNCQQIVSGKHTPITIESAEGV